MMFKRFLALILTLSAIFSVNIPVFAEEEVPPTDAVLFSDAEVAAAREIAEAAMAFEDSCPLSVPFNLSSLYNVMSIVYNNYPLLFQISPTYSYLMGEDPITGETLIVSIIFSYTMTKEEHAAACEEVRLWAEPIVAMGAEDFSDEQWALFFHDYLASVYFYDHSLTYYDLYSFITHGTGVCRAYHLAYSYLLSLVGVECSLAVSAEMVHVWSMVKINGHWHHVDATWDDGLEGAWGRATHNYFLLCDHVISDEEGGHYGWIAMHSANCHSHTREDLQYADSAFAYGDGIWYYIKKGVLSSTEDPALEGESIVDLQLVWHVWGSESGALYSDSFSGIVFRDGDIIFNGEDTIYAYDTVTKVLRSLWTLPEDSNGSIFGFILSGDTLRVDISQTPTDTGDDISITPFVPDTSILGDVNGDGRLNLFDASLLMKYTACWSVSICKGASDLTLDERLNLADVAKLMRLLAGWDM